MAEVNNFNFKAFDVGGADGAVANDGKLTGEEVQKAKNAGWTVWDEFRECDNAEYVKNDDGNTRAFKTFVNMLSSKTYKEYSALRNKILKEKLAELGILPAKIAGKEIYNIDLILFDERYKKAMSEAEKEAREQLGLDPGAFSFGIKIGQKTDTKADAKAQEVKAQKKETPKVKDQVAVNEDFESINFNIADPKEAEAQKIAEQLKELLKYPNNFETRGRVLSLLQGMNPDYAPIVLKFIPNLVEQLDKVDYLGRGLDAQDIVKFLGVNLLEKYNLVFPNQTKYTEESLKSITDIQELSEVLKTMADEINNENYYTKVNEQIEIANRTLAEAANMEPRLEFKEGKYGDMNYKRVYLPDGRIITAYYNKDGGLKNIQVDTNTKETTYQGEKGRWHEVVYSKDVAQIVININDDRSVSEEISSKNYNFEAIKRLCEQIFNS